MLLAQIPANAIDGLASLPCVAIIAADGPRMWLVTGDERGQRSSSVWDTRLGVTL